MPSSRRHYSKCVLHGVLIGGEAVEPEDVVGFVDAGGLAGVVLFDGSGQLAVGGNVGAVAGVDGDDESDGALGGLDDATLDGDGNAHGGADLFDVGGDGVELGPVTADAADLLLVEVGRVKETMGEPVAGATVGAAWFKSASRHFMNPFAMGL